MVLHIVHVDHLRVGRVQKFKETGDWSYICQIEPDKACFQYDVAYGDYDDLPIRTDLDKVIRDQAFPIAKDRGTDAWSKKTCFNNFQ